jgi:predicted PurR-regulated permease PerM
MAPHETLELAYPIASSIPEPKDPAHTQDELPLLTRLLGGPRPRIVLTTAALIVVIAGLKAAQEPLVILMLASLLAILSLPLVTFLQKHHVPTVVAVFVAVALDLTVLAGLGALIAIGVQEFSLAPEKYSSSIQAFVDRIAPALGRLGIDIKTRSLVSLLGDGTLAGVVGGTLHSVASLFSAGVFVLLTMAFILVEATGIPVKLKSAFGVRRPLLRRITRITREIQRYLLIKTAISAVAAMLFGGWLSFLNIDFAILWSLFAFAMNYVPNIGAVIAVLPPILFALMQYGIAKALLVLIGNMVIYTFLGNLIEPHLMGRRFGLSPLVIFLSLIFWGWVWGPVGMLLAVPLMMIVKISFENSLKHRWIAVLLDPSTPSRRRHRRQRRTHHSAPAGAVGPS